MGLSLSVSIYFGSLYPIQDEVNIERQQYTHGHHYVQPDQVRFNLAQ
jgi:hypothetical protein